MRASSFVCCSALNPIAFIRRYQYRQAIAKQCKPTRTNRYQTLRSSSHANVEERENPASWNDVRQSTSIRHAVRRATRIFEQAGVPEPAASAEHLAVSSFDHIGTRTSALADVTEPKPSELEQYLQVCQQREEKGVPIQYLVGNWDFHDITLLVRPPVLIPRPETEELVEHLLNDVKEANARILDVGTGSGCILLAALAARPGWSAMGIDISAEAVRLCSDNVSLLTCANRVEILLGTVRDVSPETKFDALVSNPPYIPQEDSDSVERQVMDHEDARALFGGKDGMNVIRDILDAAPRLVKDGGSVWMEVDDSQPRKLAEMHFEGVDYVKQVNDMNGKPRFCHFRVS